MHLALEWGAINTDMNNTLNIIEGIWPKVILATNLESNVLMNDTKHKDFPGDSM